MTPLAAEAQGVLATHARSFSWAALFLPPPARVDGAILYAFCRQVDDRVDALAGATDPAARAAAEADLAAMEAQLTRRAPAAPLIGACLEIFDRGQIPVAPALELIQGVRTDLGDVTVQTRAELLQYCYRVAGTVGWMMCAVIGVRDRTALAFALDLGIGMQLTNICRDVLEDARMGRVYLPADALRAAGTTPEALRAGEAPPEAVTAVVRELLALAERYYASGEAGFCYIPWRTRLAISVAATLYRGIGRRLLRRGANPLLGRTILPFWERALLTARAVSAFCVSSLARPSAHAADLHHPLQGLPGVHA